MPSASADGRGVTGFGSHPGEDHRDYNMWWPPDQVVSFLKTLRPMLDRQGLEDVKLSPGETQNWYRFHMWGYARAIFDDPVALKNLGIITSHSFANTDDTHNAYYGDWRSNGQDLLRSKRPALPAWVTSMSWGNMDSEFIEAIRKNVYVSKCNAVIPWTVVKLKDGWIGGDPNPATAILIEENGTFRILKGYYYYKQVCRAGQSGMHVVHVESLAPEVNAIAFSASKTRNPDVFIIINIKDKTKETSITIHGTQYLKFEAFRTSDNENYQFTGEYSLTENKLNFSASPNSVTTFYGKR